MPAIEACTYKRAMKGNATLLRITQAAITSYYSGKTYGPTGVQQIVQHFPTGYSIYSQIGEIMAQFSSRSPKPKGTNAWFPMLFSVKRMEEGLANKRPNVRRTKNKRPCILSRSKRRQVRQHRRWRCTATKATSRDILPQDRNIIGTLRRS